MKANENMVVKVDGGDKTRMEALYERVAAAVAESGLGARVVKGTATGSISAHTAPAMTVGGARVASPESLTAAGIAKIVQLASGGELGQGGPLSLPFSERFRATGRDAEVGGLRIGEVVDDATGVCYLASGGSLAPLLRADGTPERAR